MIDLIGCTYFCALFESTVIWSNLEKRGFSLGIRGSVTDGAVTQPSIVSLTGCLAANYFSLQIYRFLWPVQSVLFYHQ